MNAESSPLRSTGTTSSDMRAIWPGALLVVYLAITGFALLVGFDRVWGGGVALHFGVLLAIAAATWIEPVPRWLRSWAPLLALLFLYSEMPMLIRVAGHADLFDATVIRWERTLFGSQPALEWAIRWPALWLSETLHLAYLAYYPMIFAVPAALYFTTRGAEFSEAVFVLMLAFIVCFLCYIAFPVAGPRYSWATTSAAPRGPARSLVVWLLESRSSRGTAFPSSHVAVAVTQALLAFRYFGRKGVILASLTFGLALGAVYGGFHYAVDVITGLVIGCVITPLGLLSVKRRDQANATAPT